MAPRKVRYLRDVQSIARRALESGGQVTANRTVTWKASGDCSRPVPLTIEGRADLAYAHDRWGDPKRIWPNSVNSRPAMKNEYHYQRFLFVDMEVPCRKCPECLRRRSRHWAARAKFETLAAPRTWFGTLTANPDWQTRMRYRAVIAAEKRGVDLLAEGQEEIFRAVSSEMGKEATLWLKRVRAQSKASLRYILVVEAHKSGLPHMHCLIHDCATGSPVKWRHLHDQWSLGFSRFKLISLDEKTKFVSYVCKYLSKSPLARVRASLNYGNPSP